MASTRKGKGATPEGETETQSVVAERLDGDLRLLVSSAAGSTSHTISVGRRFVLGRGIHSDIVIDDPSISRAHARIDCTGAHPLLEDLGSRNGTVILGQKLKKGDQLPLRVGGAFEIGAVTIVLQRDVKDQGMPLEQQPIVHDPAVRELYASLEAIAPSPLAVLVLGETGTGKEVFAEAIHARSPRRAKPFLAINCAALSETLLESELFGHEKGAFTGATNAKIGLFQAGNDGSIFLDEVGELSVSTQAKLLRVLENGEVMPLGSVKPRRVDVRFIAATNRDLLALTQTGRFRTDLYYRLNGFRVTLPPLRRRPADILPLAERFAKRAAASIGCVTPELSDASTQLLLGHAWPGNVRELRNAIERAVSLALGGTTIEPKHLSLEEPMPSAGDLAPEPSWSRATIPPRALDSAGASESDERTRLLAALQKTSGNQTEAAKLLGMSRRTLINKIVVLGIARPRKGKA